MSRRAKRDATLERLLQLLENHNPELIKSLSADSEERFVNAAESVLARVIGKFEEGAKHYSKLQEPDLSRILVDMLSLAGMSATAEQSVNGHVDVVIECVTRGRWKYLGECKIYNGYQYHVDGCAQLLGYCTGREYRAFMLVFFNTPNMQRKLGELRMRMDRELPLQQTMASAPHGMKGAFLTRHEHRNGDAVELLHAGCSVHSAVLKESSKRL